MLIISTVLYSALTIIFIPALIVLIYMIVTNSKYSDVINVYGISSSGISGLLTLLITGYLFLAGLCVGDLPALWKNLWFLLSAACSAVIALIICRILNYMNRDKIKYANIILADEEIQNKILECSNQLQDMQKTMNSASYPAEAREINKQRIENLRATINKMAQIHNELQEQKIVMNANIGLSCVKNIELVDNGIADKALDKGLDKFRFNRSIDSNFRGVEDIMKKYKI